MKTIVGVQEVQDIIDHLQDKHDAFLGTQGEVARQSFKNGLSWAIGSLEELIKNP